MLPHSTACHDLPLFLEVLLQSCGYPEALSTVKAHDKTKRHNHRKIISAERARLHVLSPLPVHTFKEF